MNDRVAKEEIALLMPNTLSHYTQEPKMTTMTNEPTLMSRISSAINWVIELPHRRAVLNELNMLSDHELADIGLNRSDLTRVFDPNFAAQRASTRATAGRAVAA